MKIFAQSLSKNTEGDINNARAIDICKRQQTEKSCGVFLITFHQIQDRVISVVFLIMKHNRLESLEPLELLWNSVLHGGISNKNYSN